MRGRILLQDMVSRCYLAMDNSWVASCQSAKSFDHTWTALFQGLQYRDKRLQVVWCFRNPASSFYAAVRLSDNGVIGRCGWCPFEASSQPPHQTNMPTQNLGRRFSVNQT